MFTSQRQPFPGHLCDGCQAFGCGRRTPDRQVGFVGNLE